MTPDKNHDGGPGLLAVNAALQAQAHIARLTERLAFAEERRDDALKDYAEANEDRKQLREQKAIMEEALKRILHNKCRGRHDGCGEADTSADIAEQALEDLAAAEKGGAA